MKKNLVVHIDTDTRLEIPVEEVMFLASFKTNILSNTCKSVTQLEVLLSDHDSEVQDNRIDAIVKVEAEQGEYAGYSSEAGWEPALAKAFENILNQMQMATSFPSRENIN